MWIFASSRSPASSGLPLYLQRTPPPDLTGTASDLCHTGVPLWHLAFMDTRGLRQAKPKQALTRPSTQEMAQKVHDRTACRWHHEHHGENEKGVVVREGDGSLNQGIMDDHPAPAPGKTFLLARRAGRRKGREERVVRKNARVEGWSTADPVVADREGCDRPHLGVHARWR